jgi:hypothetical protein
MRISDKSPEDRRRGGRPREKTPGAESNRVIEQDKTGKSATEPRRSARALRSVSSARPGGQSAHPLFQSCFPLRGKSTPVSVSQEGEPKWPEPAEHTRQEHPDHGNNLSRAEYVGCRRRRWPRENKPSGRNSNGKKRTWPPLTTNTITAIARPIASTRINGPPLNSAFPGQRGSRPPMRGGRRAPVRPYVVSPSRTSPRQAPVSSSRFSISCLNRSRSPRT